MIYFLRGSTLWLICCFIVILHIERKWHLKRNLATILPLKSKLFGKFQHFTSPKQWSVWRKLFSLPPDKSFLRFWDKKFWKETYRNIQKFSSQMVWECSFCVTKNVAMQMFFQSPTRDRVAGVYFYLEWVEFRKMCESFWAKLHCKMRDLCC